MGPLETIPPGEHIEHGWLLPDAFGQSLVINTWREGEPENRKPPAAYGPEKVTRVVGAWHHDDGEEATSGLIAWCACCRTYECSDGCPDTVVTQPEVHLASVRDAIYNRLQHPDGRWYDGSEFYPLRLTMVDENGAWAGEVKPVDGMVLVRDARDGLVERTQADRRHEPHPLDPWVTHASAAEVAEFIRHGNKPDPGVSSTSLPPLDVLQQTAQQSRGTPFVSDGPYVTPQPDEPGVTGHEAIDNTPGWEPATDVDERCATLTLGDDVVTVRVLHLSRFKDELVVIELPESGPISRVIGTTGWPVVDLAFGTVHIKGKTVAFNVHDGMMKVEIKPIQTVDLAVSGGI